MKNNKRLALLLTVIVAAAAVAVPVFGASSDAGIEFKEGDGPTIVDPGTDLPGVYSSDIDFGERELTSAAAAYKSTENGKAANTQAAGFAVSNNKPSAGYKVTVQITGFKIGSNATMEGFTLELKPDATGVQTTTPPSPNAKPTANTVNIAAGAGGVAGATSVIMESASDNSVGMFGCNWEGILNVPANTALTQGNAKAVMTWAIQTV